MTGLFDEYGEKGGGEKAAKKSGKGDKEKRGQIYLLLADTPFAEQVAQYQAHLEGILGKAIAEGVEGHDLDASYENDAYLLGGGGLIGTLLVGAVGSKAGKALDGNSSAVNHNSQRADGCRGWDAL